MTSKVVLCYGVPAASAARGMVSYLIHFTCTIRNVPAGTHACTHAHMYLVGTTSLITLLLPIMDPFQSIIRSSVSQVTRHIYLIPHRLPRIAKSINNFPIMFQNYLLTPPRSLPRRRSGGNGIFSGRHTRMGGFYEDLYDPRNIGEEREAEEAGEGPGEKCESETESETESGSDVAVNKNSSYEGQGGRNRRNARVSVGGEDVVVEGEEKTKAKKRKKGVMVVNDSDSEGLEDHEDDIFKIAPNLNSKTSIPRSEIKKLKARKQCGLYHSKAHASDDEDEIWTRSRRGKRSKVAIRPAHRTLFKQQLKERLADKKKAEQAAKRAQRQQKTVTVKKKDRRGIAAKAMVVMVDNGGINFSEYQRFG